MEGECEFEIMFTDHLFVSFLWPAYIRSHPHFNLYLLSAFRYNNICYIEFY